MADGGLSQSPPVPESVALDLADQGIHLKPGWLADCAQHLRLEHGPARWARLDAAGRREHVYRHFLRCDLRVAGAASGALRRPADVARMSHGEALRAGQRCAVQLDEARREKSARARVRRERGVESARARASREREREALVVRATRARAPAPSAMSARERALRLARRGDVSPLSEYLLARAFSSSSRRAQVVDVGVPTAEREARAAGAAEAPPRANARCLKFHLSDGARGGGEGDGARGGEAFVALERSPIAALRADCAAGAKLLLLGPIEARRARARGALVSLPHLLA
jgi:hypothetical protein